MRYASNHKSRTKQRILTAATQQFNGRGYAATWVARVMQACGLTVGGFYAHFQNKEALLAEVLACTPYHKYVPVRLEAMIVQNEQPIADAGQVIA